MKQIYALLTVILVITVFCGCNKASTQSSSSSQLVLSQGTDASKPQQVNDSPAEQELKIVSKENTKIKAQMINTDLLRFTRVLGTRKSFENALPEPVKYDEPYLYYENMAVVMANSTDSSDTVNIGQFNVQTGENKKLSKINMNIMAESQLLMNEQAIFYLPNRTDENEVNWLDIILLDAAKGTQKTVASYPSGSVFAYSKKLNDTQAVFFLYQQKDSTVRKLEQLVIKYDITTETLTTLYEGKPMDWTNKTSTNDIWAMDIFENNIYLLRHQLVDNNMKTFLQILDANGAEISQTELSALQKYNNKDITVGEITVLKNFVVLNYSNKNSVVLKKVNDEYIPLKLPSIKLKKLLTPLPVNDRYAFFSIGALNSKDIETIFVLDLKNEHGTLVKLDVPNCSKILGDSDGNLIVLSASDEEENLYTVNAKDILATSVH
ncbi:MAG: hypothetical protein RR654_05575 [Oscillospiraceae bacterium]